MAINYEPSGPFAPGISAGYGAAQVQQQNMAVIASQYANNQRLAVEGQQQQAAQRQQAAAADQQANLGYAQLATQTQDRGREQAANLGERQAEYAASREPSARDAFMAQVQADDARRKAELQVFINQQEVGQAEQMQLQRDQNAVAEIMANPNLFEHEKRDMILQLKTKIDPVQQRLKNQEIETQKQLAQRAIAQADLAHQTQLRHAALESQTLEERTKSQQLPDGTWVHEVTGTDGKRNVQYSKERAGAAAAKPFDAAKALKDAQAEADVAYPPKPNELGKVTRSDENVKYTADLWRQRRDQHQARQQPQGVGVGGGRPTGQGGDYSGGQQQAAGQPPPPPFDLTRPETAAPVQRVQVETWDKLRGLAERVVPEGPRRESYVAHANWARGALATFGSTDAMRQQAPEIFDRYNKVLDAMEGLGAPPKPPEPERTAKEKLDRGELVTLKDVGDMLRKAGVGVAVDAPGVRARLAEAARKFERGELVTTSDLTSWWNKTIMSAAPNFLR